MNIDKTFKKGSERTYQKGQIVLYQGEKTNQVFRVAKGSIKVYDVTAEGNEKLLLILGVGDLFPLIWTFKGEEPLYYFYETFEDDTVLEVLEKGSFIDVLKETPEFTMAVLEYFVNRSSDLMARIECIEASSALHKICQVYKYLAKAHGEDSLKRNTVRIKLSMTHQHIADMAGLTRPTTTIQINELEEKGCLSFVKDHALVNLKKIDNLLG